MFHQLFSKLSDLPTIVQSAAGSALFWIILIVGQFVGSRLLKAAGMTNEMIGRSRKYREYIYRRYTAMSGLINYVQGFQYTISKAFSGLLTGLMFCCIALLVGGSSPIVWGICFMSALVYFGSGLLWLKPSARWDRDDLPTHWLRIAELEKDLFGKVHKETLDRLADFKQPQPSSESK